MLERLLPFAPGYGMETGMTIDALRAGYGLTEIELDLEHRATGRDRSQASRIAAASSPTSLRAYLSAATPKR